VDVGLMIYDQSWRADLGTTLTPPIIERLAGLDNVVSLKYGSANLLKDMGTVIERFSDRFAFIDNSLGFTATVSHMHGATGHISGPSTWWPEFELRFFDMMEQGQYTEAERWQSRLAPYMAYHTGEFWKSHRYFHDSAVIKASLDYVGLHGGPLRAPFRAMTPSEKEELHAVMDGIGARRAVATPA
jgi:dihydrodipicolinate synthase/N-acetylneuraminate lyase